MKAQLSCFRQEMTWIVDGPWIVKNVKNVSVSSDLQIEDCGAYIDCPNCGYRNDNRNVLTPWPGLPKGVKFELTDEEVIEHLEAKCGIDGSKPNPFIQDFICSVDDINYTHPENLPGVNKDGTSAFFFNETVLAYPKGERKRRLITPSVLTDASVRWRKTGKTKPVMVNGVHKGCKKFMVLYKSAKKGLKPEKSKWVMHQYHLGREEAETGEFVVSKIMYQQQQVIVPFSARNVDVISCTINGLCFSGKIRDWRTLQKLHRFL
uniref:NAC domain-containing protein n=1 Tax=Brassica campestris TaxID=3711 RepID=M4CPW8_BRACM